MIEKMRRAGIVVPASCAEAALEALRGAGLMHVDSSPARGEGLQALVARKGRCEAALAIAGQKKPKKGATPLALEAGQDLAEAVIAFSESKKALSDEALALKRERAKLALWGDSAPDDKEALAREGIRLRFFSCDERRLKQLPEGLEWICIGGSGKQARACAVSRGPGEEAPLPEWVEEYRVPDRDIKSIDERLARIALDLEKAERGLEGASLRKAEIKALLAAADEELEFAEKREGLGKDESGFVWLSGYLPARDEEAFRALARKEAWALVIRDPLPEESPPTLVRYKPVIRLVKPIFDFLELSPNYREYEISPWFLAFFTLFFGMIIGDAGYGAIMLAASLIFGAKLRFPVAAKLAALLSASTVAWGAVTGSWFALPVASLPEALRGLVLEPFMGDKKAVQFNIMVFCFIIALVQLSLAHVKNIVRDFPKPKFIAQVGWLAMVVGLFFFVLNLVLDKNRFPIEDWHVYLVLCGFVLYFFFQAMEGSFVKGILEALKNFLPSFLSAIGCLGDIISYIRLFAVGLAGLAISETVNGMAAGIGFDAPDKAAMALLVIAIGHSLNIVLSLLSVIVHGIRLNVLEFSGHLGMEWSGQAFKPFAKRKAAANAA
jgi:V/A-type H+-transporting ATPase subunit I